MSARARPARKAEIERELRAAREQQAATAEILRVISSSPNDAQPVFEAIAESAVRLCEAEFCSVFRFDGKLIHFAAHHGLSPQAVIEHGKVYPMPPGRQSTAARAIQSGVVEQIPDVLADAEYAIGPVAKTVGARSVMSVPLMRNGEPIGAINVAHALPGLFLDRHIELLRTFADQAVIAIENARLFEEAQARTRQVTEALEQQVATSEILRVISRSPKDTQPVFDIIAESAARLCNAQFCFVYRYDGELLHFAAHHGLPRRAVNVMRRSFPKAPGRGSAGERAVLSGEVAYIPDVDADPDFQLGALNESIDKRTALAVPMLRGGIPIGAISIAIDKGLTDAPPEKQTGLLRSFADQAVIAIENVRLFDEVKARTAELSEALQQQTATADVLKVISRSAFDLQSVLDSLVESAARVCEAEAGVIFQREGDIYHFGASYGYTAEFKNYALANPHPAGRDSLTGRAALARKTVQIADVLADPDYAASGYQERAGFRTGLGVPLLRHGLPIGVFVLTRALVRPFSKKQIELVETFADQAVIAIENARLFDEVQARNRELSDALEQQVATGAILRAIAASPTDVQPVLNAVAESAAQLCDAHDANLMLRRGDMLAVAAHHGTIPIDYTEVPIVQGMVSGRAVLDGAPIHVHDMAVVQDEFPESYAIALRLGVRTLVTTPLLREGEAIGALMIRRTEVRPFSEKQIELLKTFADQAAIAIQNVRLFEQVQERTTELTEALQQQTATADVLKVISRSAFDLDAVLTTLIRSSIQLCDATRGVIWLRKGEQFFLAAHVNYSDEWVAFAEGNPITPAPDALTTSGIAAFTGEVVSVEDILADPRFRSLDAHKLGDYRAGLAVPLKRDGKVEGVISLSRPEAKLFTERQTALVQTFADQAVIAIENVRLFEQVQARNHELAEALEQQVATSGILRAIASSPTDLEPLLKIVAESATQLCDAYDASILLKRGDALAFVAHHGPVPRFLPELPLSRDIVTSRAFLDKVPVHVHDLLAAADEYPEGFAFAKRLGFRTVLSMPLLREDEAIGAIMIRRNEVRPFSDKQIGLFQTFADQAVIAIENMRLFEEVQARTRDLSESLEQQTATGEVLRVIASSPTAIEPVLQALVESAARLCDAYDSLVLLRQGDSLVSGAHYGPIPYLQPKWPLARDWVSGRSVIDRETVQVPDLVAAGDEFPAGREMSERFGHRTVLATPLMREGEAIGTIVLRRIEVRPFTEKQIELLKTFADQAVIAIQNVRLFDEVQARTTDLAEALQQQTATADVLKVISRSTFDLRAVLQTLIESAASLGGADQGGIYMLDGDVYRLAAASGMSPELRAHEEANPSMVGRDSFVGRAALEKSIIHIPDATKDAEYGMPYLPTLGNFRAALTVPLMREGSPIGVFSMSRSEPGPFSNRQIELVQTFADQAVIAIENARLFEEVQARTAELGEALQQQTATADVLKVISRSTFDLQAVLDALAETATRVCEADKGCIFQRDGDLYKFSANFGFSPELEEYARSHPFEAGRGSTTARVALEGRTVHNTDVLADPEYRASEYQRHGGYRTMLGVPLLRGTTSIGVFILTRPDVNPFTDKQIELVETFADQAVIAIQNVRLFEEVQARTQELSRSLADLQAAQDRLIQTEKLASLGQLTAGIAHEIKNPLNFVNNFSALSAELIDELRQALAGAALDDKTRAGIEELADMLQGNLGKVVQHGKRADSIVKNMLRHSREGSGEHRPVDINAVVEESLNLAYHGARAEKQGFNVTIEKALDPQAGEVDLFPQEITRVFLNLISNGFYATTKRKAATGDGYEPTLSAVTKNLGDSVEIRIRDNGTGIPAEVKEKMFNPFFTTKPAGEGTGLGLSLSHDIVVKQHAGTIEVDTEPGEFTEFRIVLPRGAASLGTSRGGTA